MDIRNWPMNKIMQLPDCCFGRRWIVGTAANVATLAHGYNIIGVGLPDRCVIWSIYFNPGLLAALRGLWRIALGDHLPATAAEFDAFELLLQGVEDWDNNPGTFLTHGQGSIVLDGLRLMLEPQGRRLVVDFYNGDTSFKTMSMYFVISSIPTEVPDWLCSGRV